MTSREDALQRDINRHDKELADVWTAIDQLRNRPPVWTTVLISVLSMFLGSALTVVCALVKAVL